VSEEDGDQVVKRYEPPAIIQSLPALEGLMQRAIVASARLSVYREWEMDAVSFDPLYPQIPQEVLDEGFHANCFYRFVTGAPPDTAALIEERREEWLVEAQAAMGSI
jgi:hypothetical protein